MTSSCVGCRGNIRVHSTTLICIGSFNGDFVNTLGEDRYV